MRRDAGIGSCVVVTVVDVLGGAVLLTGDLVTILRGEMAAIGCAHVALLIAKSCLVRVGCGRAFGCDLSIGDTLVDAVLLARVAGVDGVTLLVGG